MKDRLYSCHHSLIECAGCQVVREETERQERAVIAAWRLRRAAPKAPAPKQWEPSAADLEKVWDMQTKPRGGQRGALKESFDAEDTEAQRAIAAIARAETAEKALREIAARGCHDFSSPASCLTNDGTGLWCESCLAAATLAEGGKS